MPPTDKPAPHDPQLDTSVSRREFARRAVVGAASAAVLPLRELVPSAAASEPPQPSHASPQTHTGAPKLSPQSQAEADSKYHANLKHNLNPFTIHITTNLNNPCHSTQPT